MTIITKKNKNVDASLKLLDFLASDEGFKLVHYGIEGVHYDMVDGKPVAKKEFFDKFDADTTGKAKKNEGFGIGFESMSGLDRTVTPRRRYLGRPRPHRGDGERAQNFPSERHQGHLRLQRGRHAGEIAAIGIAQAFHGPDYDVWQEAIFTKSDDAALKVINDLREQMNKTGYPKRSSTSTRT